jgi:hypothetical protein
MYVIEPCITGASKPNERLYQNDRLQHLSGVTITYLQENKTTVTTASGNSYTVLFSAATVEANSSTIAADNSTV